MSKPKPQKKSQQKTVLLIASLLLYSACRYRLNYSVNCKKDASKA